jgi:SAM-dependent methyltransferase
VAGFYDDDLAYIHDAGFGDFSRGAAPALLRLLRQAALAGGLVVDLGCGSGIWARELASAGYDVLGVDVSAAMIALARERVPEGTFRRGSLLAAKVPPCVAVTAIGECLCYFGDGSDPWPALPELFRRIHDALRPGGLLLFDVAAPGRVPGRGPRKGWREGEDWTVLVEAEEDRRRKLLTRRITTFRKVGTLYRRGDEVHRLRLYTRAELGGLLRQAGFRVGFLRAYGKQRFPPGYFAVVARKPG